MRDEQNLPAAEEALKKSTALHPVGKLQSRHSLMRRVEVFVCLLNELNASSCVRTKFITTVSGTLAFSAKIKSQGH